MLYTVQLHTESGNYACPDGKGSLYHCRNKQECHDALLDWMDEVSRYDDASCSALVWRGHHGDVTDAYPDAEITIGPRGGIRWFPC
jgi:hypothetical protein